MIHVAEVDVIDLIERIVGDETKAEVEFLFLGLGVEALFEGVVTGAKAIRWTVCVRCAGEAEEAENNKHKRELFHD